MPETQTAPTTVRLSFDGVSVEVPAGTNLIEAARRAGITIPHYCYHPRLSIAANCRMCLVEASTSPKLLPGCQTPVVQGMEVRTQTAKVKEAQRAVLELLLLNHPVDCPICDQAGECKLQNYYMQFDCKPSRLVGPKLHKAKRKILGPTVVLDQERCILCTRCVRFMREVAKNPQLSVFNRGSHEVIDVFPGRPLDSNYAGNTVDLCPVGALLSRDFRFKARAFFLSTTPSVCTGCARGCSVFLDHFNGETYRYRPRKNTKVNDSWMCDVGRLSYKYLVHDRALEPKVGRAGEGRTASAQEAVHQAALRLKPLVADPALGLMISPMASVEDLLGCFALARHGLKVERAFVGGRAGGDGDDLLLCEDRNPNRLGLEKIARAFGISLKPFEALTQAIDAGEVKAIYAVGAECPTDPNLLASLFLNLDPVIIQSFKLGPVAGMAQVLLPASPCSESDGTFVNFQGRSQRFAAAYSPRGQSQPHWAWAGMLLDELGMPVHWKSARDVFRELSAEVPELKGFGWDDPSLLPHPQRGIGAAPAAADGRPAGYRERCLP
jgi:NADH-quinone oxidoreductase subunit G